MMNKIMNKKGASMTSVLTSVVLMGILILVMIMWGPKSIGQGFSNIDSQFCLASDTDRDGVSDSLEKFDKRCICNEDIPSKQFYLIDTKFVNDKSKHAEQTLFLNINGKSGVPEKISYEDVTRMAKYIYEKEAYNAQKDPSLAKPQLVLKSNVTIQSTPELSAFCFSKTTDCTIEDFKEDFFMKESTYTYITQCEIPNDSDECKKLRSDRCAQEQIEKENAKKTESQT